MPTLKLNTKTLATQTSSAEPVIATGVTGSPTIALTNATGTMPNSTQDNITRLGTVASGTLGSNVVFPSGKVSNVTRFTDTTSGDTYISGTLTYKVSSSQWTIACTSGRHYIIIGSQGILPYSNSFSTSIRYANIGLYYGTASRSKGSDLDAGDTRLMHATLGRELYANDSGLARSFLRFDYQGYFTASSSVDHYIYTASGVGDTGGVTAKTFADTGGPHVCTIWEVMP